MNLYRTPKILILTLAASLALALASVSAGQVTWGDLESVGAPQGYSGVPGLIKFDGTGQFTFGNASLSLTASPHTPLPVSQGNGFSFVVDSAGDSGEASNGDFGWIDGTFDLGAITTTSTGGHAFLTPIGTPTITFWDGVGSTPTPADELTADVGLSTLTETTNSGGASYFLSDEVTINLTNFSDYTGPDLGLIALEDGTDQSIDFSFTLAGSRVKTLEQLEATAVSDAYIADISYSMPITSFGVPDTGATFGFFALALAAVGLGATGWRRQPA